VPLSTPLFLILIFDLCSDKRKEYLAAARSKKVIFLYQKVKNEKTEILRQSIIKKLHFFTSFVTFGRNIMIHEHYTTIKNERLNNRKSASFIISHSFLDGTKMESEHVTNNSNSNNNNNSIKRKQFFSHIRAMKYCLVREDKR